jgi:hypothetical protein
MWTPKGETPVLQDRFRWKQLSILDRTIYWRFYVRLFNDSIPSSQIVELLKALHATIGKDLLISCDYLQVLRPKVVRAHSEAQLGRIALERLPT